MDYFPLFINLKNKHCLVVGAGEIAARKIELLAKAGAKIAVIAPEISASVMQLAANNSDIEISIKKFSTDDISQQRLIISATNQADINALVAATADAHNIPVNVVDKPALCSFIVPAIIDRSPALAAVSSGGTSPVLARLLRAKLESLIPPAFGRMAKLAEKYRALVKENINPPAQRRIFWEKVLQGSIAELFYSGKEAEAESRLKDAILNSPKQLDNSGEVYLVGAGPGDPDLLTFRALRLMQQADVVVYDRLVSTEILQLVRRDAEKIYVGKQRDNHSLPQESINELLARLAKEGKRVVRLKGGDPFIFGRGGEEIETLAEQNINFQVVPGITAASGCATYAGIPLTHRDHAQSCTFVTGHLKNNRANLNWQQLAAPGQTIVIYMGLVGLGIICQSLIQHGAVADLPIALIQQGTTQRQRVITGTLSNLPDKLKNQGIHPPTLFIIGTVVSLHDALKWFHADDMHNTTEDFIPQQ
ncbi:uroporphyrin-III C-methyltransferase/precorrin-2 dehydrogenase/sirohydrochlorin ferrochelatase [Bathymodiolus japonicus methanotrophic gill symbiont]|uniref:siroheme synthase CysG n=1 Tax=Bathymodiolus japonicus methanotrophic gill symbiont TaxID=113269 RepID=UPI001B403AEF|nr:siroheme synthase CysG [Bathymodiolus japonicus methanotrophic gill symbiont]GFO72033.1 uroporphyrin-III C-methyltransferase/precorrin-2 dehydrogenase/sirohydrochlorin ferrochelatase [Bathymodiolus japonicus methanotrophic gill symbiont]